MVYPTILKLVALLILFIVINTKVTIEEKLLSQRYSHFNRYQRLTNKFIPKIKKPNIDFDLPNLER
jgi:steroid 5-alpha reductase family enzyme